MTVYSWNMLFKNKRLPEAFEWIRQCEFDIFCLQEVPEPFLEQLKTLPYHLVYAREGERHFPRRTTRAYVAILSKHPLGEEILFTIPDPPKTFISRVFMRTMRWAFITERHAVAVDVQMPGQKHHTRIVSVHISLSTPRTREQELHLVFGHCTPGQPTIVSGDFNIIESFKVAPLNTIMGGPIRETFARKKERRNVEKLFASHGLANPLRGSVTHPFSKSQLDHILATPDFEIVSKGVIKKGFGSDHHPVFISTK